MRFPLNRSCKDVAALVVAMQDRDLTLKDKIALKVHLAICQTCPKFAKQFLTMKNAMRQWRNYADDAASEKSDANNSAK